MGCYIWYSEEGTGRDPSPLRPLLTVPNVDVNAHPSTMLQFNRSTNAIFGKVGRVASEEVTLQLVKSKCLPILLYGLVECYSLLKADLHSLDFVVIIFLMKLFRTANKDIIDECPVSTERT